MTVLCKILSPPIASVDTTTMRWRAVARSPSHIGLQQQTATAHVGQNPGLNGLTFVYEKVRYSFFVHLYDPSIDTQYEALEMAT